MIRRQRAGLAEILGLSFPLSSTQDQPQGKVKERLVVEDKGKKDKPSPARENTICCSSLVVFCQRFPSAEGKNQTVDDVERRPIVFSSISLSFLLPFLFPSSHFFYCLLLSTVSIKHQEGNGKSEAPTTEVNQ